MSNNLSFKTVQDLAHLGAEYLLMVLKVMDKGATVQFGETGQGGTPNYQICRTDGSKTAYYGRSKEYKTFDLSEFDDSHISDHFGLVQIAEAIEVTA